MGNLTQTAGPNPDAETQVPADPRGQHLHIDCASGAAGDMLLGALIDVGVPLDVIGDALDAIGAGRARLAVHRVVKGGIAAADVKVDTTGHILPQQSASVVPSGTPTPPAGIPVTPGAKKRAGTEAGKFVAIKFRAETHDHHVHVDEIGDKTVEVHERAHGDGVSHSHDHSSHAHYHYADIRWRIARAPLSEGARMRALDIFDRLARAEAKLHGTTIDEVRLHEVGAIDSIVDIVGTAAALDWLRPLSVSCSSVAMGHGTLKSAHGTLPVPAPAALEVLREAGGVMADGGLPSELCTPTGAAILAATVTSWKPSPAGRVISVGWGAGDADLADRPNVLRVVALAPARLPTEIAAAARRATGRKTAAGSTRARGSKGGRPNPACASTSCGSGRRSRVSRSAVRRRFAWRSPQSEPAARISATPTASVPVDVVCRCATGVGSARLERRRVRARAAVGTRSPASCSGPRQRVWNAARRGLRAVRRAVFR